MVLDDCNGPGSVLVLEVPLGEIDRLDILGKFRQLRWEDFNEN